MYGKTYMIKVYNSDMAMYLDIYISNNKKED